VAGVAEDRFGESYEGSVLAAPSQVCSEPPKWKWGGGGPSTNVQRLRVAQSGRTAQPYLVQPQAAEGGLRWQKVAQGGGTADVG
jgi:hypothetical protein